jgi:hypothetical protein
MTGHANFTTVLRVALVLVFGLGPAYAQATNDAAQGAAKSWVGLVDGAQYAESWQAAGSFVKNRMPQQNWAQVHQMVRAPLGPVKSRALKSRTATKTFTMPPGVTVPDGEYVVLRFNVVFEKAVAPEEITVQRELDGQWRVVAYFMR